MPGNSAQSNTPTTGHVVFVDGYSLRFSWREPSAGRLNTIGGFYACMVRAALAAANNVRCGNDYTEADIVRLWLSE